MKIPTLALLLLTALPTYARLGEIKAQCEARYGKPTGTTESGGITYQKGGMNIQIVFWKDKASRISFSADDPNEPGYALDKKTPLTQAQLDTLLKANSGNSTWKKDENTGSENTSWTRASDQAFAIYSIDGMDLTLYDLAYVEHLETEKDKKKTKDLEGF